jgi:MbtH protein
VSVIQYVAVKNDEDQYALWDATKQPPAGWVVMCKPTTKEDCLAFIRENWVDMTPKSARPR